MPHRLALNVDHRIGELADDLGFNLPEPDTLAEEIIENLESGLASFRAVLAGLRKVG